MSQRLKNIQILNRLVCILFIFFAMMLQSIHLGQYCLNVALDFVGISILGVKKKLTVTKIYNLKARILCEKIVIASDGSTHLHYSDNFAAQIPKRAAKIKYKFSQSFHFLLLQVDHPTVKDIRKIKNNKDAKRIKTIKIEKIARKHQKVAIKPKISLKCVVERL